MAFATTPEQGITCDILKISPEDADKDITIIRHGGDTMAGSILSKRTGFLDRKIEEFCESSSQLLTAIHEKYSAMIGEDGKPKKKKRGRKKKIPENPTD